MTPILHFEAATGNHTEDSSSSYENGVACKLNRLSNLKVKAAEYHTQLHVKQHRYQETNMTLYMFSRIRILFIDSTIVYGPMTCNLNPARQA